MRSPPADRPRQHQILYNVEEILDNLYHRVGLIEAQRAHGNGLDNPAVA